MTTRIYCAILLELVRENIAWAFSRIFVGNKFLEKISLFVIGDYSSRRKIVDLQTVKSLQTIQSDEIWLVE